MIFALIFFLHLFFFVLFEGNYTENKLDFVLFRFVAPDLSVSLLLRFKFMYNFICLMCSPRVRLSILNQCRLRKREDEANEKFHSYTSPHSESRVRLMLFCFCSLDVINVIMKSISCRCIISCFDLRHLSLHSLIKKRNPNTIVDC